MIARALLLQRVAALAIVGTGLLGASVALAAKRAGLFCVAVPNPLTSQLPLDLADVRLSSMTDAPLSDLLAKLRAKR